MTLFSPGCRPLERSSLAARRWPGDRRANTLGATYGSNRRRLALVFLTGCVLWTGVVTRTWAENTAAGDDFFENRIRPRLSEVCFDCHSAKAEKLKGGLRLDTKGDLLRGGDSGPALVPGDPEHSRLLRAIQHTDPDLAMPPAKAGRAKLSDLAIADFATWIKMGAPYPEVTSDSPRLGAGAKTHWAFQPIQNPPPPLVHQETWVQTSIDPFILAKLEARGEVPAAPADRRTLIRRATFDLTGLPPTSEEIEAFLADPSRDAFARVVDRLLDSPHYGERWGRHWLDVVRYADTAGETADFPVPDAWRYRNYVINAFNADKPYDEFLREQIAGDILARRGPRERYAERVTATGFLAVSRRFGFDSENYHHLTIQDSIDTLGQTVLGLSLGCARCHNHKFDPIPATDYYALYGIFESTRYAFPGSEQKQKRRALVPLLPPDEAQPKWQAYDTRVATLAQRLQQQNLSVPAVVLRSLDDLDGDFEMQAAAAGGSQGVLVPPWVYEGPIAVTAEAQSPFKQLYALGDVGASVPGGTNRYFLAQALPPAHLPRPGQTFYVSLDFCVLTNGTATDGAHRFWLGNQSRTAAVEILISADAIGLRSGDRLESLRSLGSNRWQNLQLKLDPISRLVSGSVGAPSDVVTFSGLPMAPAGSGTIDYVALESSDPAARNRPGLKVDNLAVQAVPFSPVSDSGLAAANASSGPAVLNEKLKQLAGLDGDFELQTDETPPVKPWGPGPHSVVKISAAAQSPYHNLFAPGQRGIHLPNSGAYNGFGQTLTNRWQTESTARLYASFDFRCADQAAGGGGSWRFYVGHGPGSSPAVELFFNGNQFFRRQADAREPVSALTTGQWYQVQLNLNLKAKTYRGIIVTPTERTEFAGPFATGWDGSIDYLFIDSYGHLPGVKPALDADNFVVGESPLPPLDSAEIAGNPDLSEARRREASELRGQLAALATEAEQAKRELETLLAEGPFDLAYGVVEGTPRNARIQLRGEPEKLGDEVPRGFLRALGGGALPSDLSGSGRLQLANWLTAPENPLTARVMANRLWQYHFGTGLVKTPNDFGSRGQPPTHPELLDHLATQLQANGWSLKTMHRLILLSATYQQASQSGVVNPSTPFAAEPAREFAASTLFAPITQLTIDAPHSASLSDDYAAFPRRRLSAEEIRDAILFVSGELDPAPGRGHPFPTPIGWGYTQHGPFSAVYDHNQRSVYLMTQRLKRHPFLALFDGADPNASTAERRTTTVPTQSLFFLNDPFVHEKAARLATRLTGSGADEKRQVEAVYRVTLGRSPSEAEQVDASDFLAAYRAELAKAKVEQTKVPALAALVRTLFGANEFLHVD